MAVGCIDGLCRGKRGDEPASKHQEENQRTSAGWDERTCLARPNSHARTGTRENVVVLVQLTRSSMIANHTRLMPSLLNLVTIHTYIHRPASGPVGRINALSKERHLLSMR